METLQREDPPDLLWPTLVRRIHFTPQQQQQLAIAWELYSQQKGILLQRQKLVVQRLQALLSAQGEDASLSPVGHASASDASSSTNMNISSSSVQPLNAAQPALLLLEAAEEVERLLSEVLRITQHLTQQQRQLVTFYINTLTAEQHTSMCLNADPFFVSASKGRAYKQWHPDLQLRFSSPFYIIDRHCQG